MAQPWKRGEGWESGWGSGGGSSSGGDGGGGWAANNWAPPGAMLMAPHLPGSMFMMNPMAEQTFVKGYTKGWNDGHAVGYGKGFHAAAQNIIHGDGKGKGYGGWQEEELEEKGWLIMEGAAELATGGKKSRKKRVAHHGRSGMKNSQTLI